jgi:hypothetical protein
MLVVKYLAYSLLTDLSLVPTVVTNTKIIHVGEKYV